MTPDRRRLVADAALVAVCLVWGSTFVIVKQAVAEVPVMTFLALRFSLAFVVMAAVFGRHLRGHGRRLAWPGVLVGMLLWGGYTFQTAGLQYTQASRAGFITGLSVVLVPVFSAVITKERPSGRALGGVALALVGLVLLFLVPESGPGGLSPARPSTGMAGDLLVLAGAVCFGLHIVTLGLYSATRAPGVTEAGSLATFQVGAAALAYMAATAAGYVRSGPTAVLPAAPAAAGPPFLSSTAVAAVVITALLATAGAFFAQTLAQRHTPPTHTALIFASEPVFAAAFGWLLLGERLGPWALAGCLLILAGMVLAELRTVRPARRPAAGPGSLAAGS
ncbi:MAG: DMT family transporter [Bacillota bacterium]|nr:MAG: DMT family transporter [Bacillota bacterium]